MPTILIKMTANKKGAQPPFDQAIESDLMSRGSLTHLEGGGGGSFFNNTAW